ncbi:unnamed protein product, partial [Phaeothamnion confervicola]
VGIDAAHRAAAATGVGAGPLARLRARHQAWRRRRAARGRLHFGFWSSYSTVREKVHEVLLEELLREPGQLYITGHSLGGALGTLCAYDMALWLVPFVNSQLGREPNPKGAATMAGGGGGGLEHEHEEPIGITMYNFGSPRVGDPFFVRRYNQLVPNSFRFVCDGDVITGVPPARFGYMHVGRLAVADRMGSGSLLVDPSVLEASFKNSRRLKVVSHMFPAYTAALDGCLYPIESPDEMRRLVNDIYRDRADGEWFGCARYWLTCNGRLQRDACNAGGGRGDGGDNVGGGDGRNDGGSNGGSDSCCRRFGGCLACCWSDSEDDEEEVEEDESDIEDGGNNGAAAAFAAATNAAGSTAADAIAAAEISGAGGSGGGTGGGQSGSDMHWVRGGWIGRRPCYRRTEG